MIGQAQKKALEKDWISLDSFAAFVGDPNLARKYYVGLVDTFETFMISTHLRQAHFLGQTFIESGGFKTMEENLNYKASVLTQIFSYYKKNPGDAQKHGRTGEHAADQVAIANHAYANRIGNGGPETNDGWLYRGGGFIQLTGRANYQDFSDDTQINIMRGCEAIIESESLPFMVSGWFFKKCLAKADANDSYGVTRIINGSGMLHKEERRDQTQRALEVIKKQ